jgi:hypothetical protein
MLIQYIRSFPACLEAVFSIRNLRTRHAVVTGDPLNVEGNCGNQIIKVNMATKVPMVESQVDGGKRGNKDDRGSRGNRAILKWNYANKRG